MVRAGEDYDYFFEVDGELRYDFNCDTNSVEVLDAQGGGGMGGAGGNGLNDNTAKMVTLTPGQIIIANSIQIYEEEDTSAFSMSAFSTCSSSSDSSDENNNNDDEEEWENGPIVSWPKHVVELVKNLRPEPNTMVMPMPVNDSMFRFRGNNSDDVNMTTTMYYGDVDQYCRYYQQQQSSSSPPSSGVWSMPAKRVHFMDMPSMNAAASANAAATAMLTGTVF